MIIIFYNIKVFTATFSLLISYMQIFPLALFCSAQFENLCFRGSEWLSVFPQTTALNHSLSLAPYLKALQPTHVHHVIAALRNKTHHLHCFLFERKRERERARESAMCGNRPQICIKSYEKVHQREEKTCW